MSQDVTSPPIDNTDIVEPDSDNLSPVDTSQAREVLAVISGKEIEEVPEDLYIPPDALQIFLETFEGPLDLLLYLIQKQNLDILNIPISKITEQYLQYIALMRELQLDLAAEYLVMAALLLEIKSRMLLPREEEENEDETELDPRKQLVQQLQEYARFRKVSEELGNLPNVGRDTFLLDVDMPDIPQTRVPPKIPLEELLSAMQEVLLRMELYSAHQILQEPLSVRERMTQVLDLLQKQLQAHFPSLYTNQEGRAGVVVALLASLELVKEKLILIEQEHEFGAINVLVKTGEDGEYQAADFDMDSEYD